MKFTVFYILALLLVSSPFLQVARCQQGSEETPKDAETIVEGADSEVVGENAKYSADTTFSSATEVDTVCVFPNNPSKLVVAGEETELLVGMKNYGESTVNVLAIKASVYLPFDHTYLVQNLSTQAFNNASIPTSASAAFPYAFAVSKFLQAGTFDLVGTVIYEIDQQVYQSTFYKGTIEVKEAGGFLSMESVLLVSLGIALIGFLGLWIRNQIQNLSKKTKRASKVEVGTKTVDSSMDEWLQGTAYTQSLINKSKKKK
ncbi:translocon-associated protein subunit alpha-like [Impatiens glandulifera]|uniref:translocon-associated protein subunit alpha-like n=1 Tax=Impatiens glandulifera TaxID=253017 RepID=UPI001FB0908E|nr:translocon-associated protein subunit alpha-like [Impatiens glandulifera]